MWADMVVVIAALGAIAAGYLLGSLPLGAMLIWRVSGREPSDLNPHLLGVENVYRLVGAPLAIAAFSLDVLKGFLALALTGGVPWAALGAYFGHLHPWDRFQFVASPRGRGNGVLLGILVGMQLFGGLPLWLALIPLAVVAILLVVSRFVVLAALGALTVFVVALVITGAGSAIILVWSLVLVLAGWRLKAGLARVWDGTEARLGDPPPVRGLDPGTVLAAFMLHPMTVGDLWQPKSQRWLRTLSERGWLSEQLLRRALLRMRPQVQGSITGIRLEDGRTLKVLIVGGPMLPDQIRHHPDIAVRMAIQGARLARDHGAEAFGLGAFWSTVGDKGQSVQDAVPEIAITNGGAYTAGTVRAAVPGLLSRFEAEGGSLRRSTAAVVGANGVVAFGVARLIAGELGQLLLVGRDQKRLNRSAETLRRKHPGVEIDASTDIESVSRADLVFTATSDPGPVVLPEHVKPGAWILDLGRPGDVHPTVRSVPGVHLVPGGVVRPPGEMRSSIDLQFGDGLVPACLAETMIMTATREFDRASLGSTTRSADIDFYLREGAALGFEIVTRDDRVATFETAL